MTEIKSTQTLNWFGGIIAILIIGLLWFISYALIFVEIPTTNQTNLAQIIGMIGIQIGIIIGWFFRGSQNEKEQSKTISTLVATASKAQDALPPVAAPVIPGGSAAAPASTGDDVVLQPGQNVNVAAIPLAKPADITQAAWDLLTDAEKAAEIARRAPPK